LQLRGEIFNLLNRANFGMPGRTVFAGRTDVEAPLPTAGRITTINGPSRQLQLSVKFTF